ncbi:MAG: hypothetical protein DDT31_01315 [Syntrophomonadaceae bacterium]|nr:hypothetical protein [Bacillota bacterium]
MYSVKWIWQTLYTHTPEAFNVALAEMATYGMLAMAFELVFYPPRYGPQRYMAQQVRTGAIDTDLLKPMNFQVYMLGRNLGEVLFRFTTLVLVSCVVGVFFLDMRLPASPLNGLLFILSLGLGYLVLFSLNFLMGLLSMVTINITYLMWAYSAVVRFFAGQLIPLWFFPDGLRIVAEWLPFRSVYSIPLAIYIGRSSPEQIIQDLWFQIFWAVVLVSVGHLLWSRVQTRLVGQGG